MYKRVLIISFTLLFLMVLFGCSEKVSAPNENSNVEFGDYTASSEAPAFNDPLLLSSNDIEFDDAMMSSADFDSMITDAGYYHLRMIWGSLRYDSTIAVESDWSGSLTISRGGLIIRRLIHWERGQDSILDRTDRKLIEWISKTTVHNDGLSVDIIIPPIRPEFDTSYVTDPATGDTVDIVIDIVSPAPVNITFESGPYSRTFELYELSTLDTVITIDEFNSIAFHALKIDRRPCPRGFLSGGWGVNDEGQGIFRGEWRNRHGQVIGHYQGHYEVNENGRNIFVGKWIDQSGRFEGFIRGTYDLMPDVNANGTAFDMAGGWFAGQIYNSERVSIGDLKGRYIPASDENRGFMMGRWKINCPEFNDRMRNSEHMERDGF